MVTSPIANRFYFKIIALFKNFFLANLYQHQHDPYQIYPVSLEHNSTKMYHALDYRTHKMHIFKYVHEVITL